MILEFFDFLSIRAIDYRVTNGYKTIFSGTNTDADYDIVFRKSDFLKLGSIMIDFCKQYNYGIVQIYHHGIYAKNFFIYNDCTNEILNLDLYGELSRQRIKILDETDIFETTTQYRGISILKPHQEFIQYLIKKIDKGLISESVFSQLRQLYKKEERQCNSFIKQFFSTKYQEIIKAFVTNDFNYLEEHIKVLRVDFMTSKKNTTTHTIKNSVRFLQRIFKPTGVTIAFLGPDGAGKSTIIEGFLKQTLPFRRHDYFHLKPIVRKNGQIQKVVVNPHKNAPYGLYKSYLKLFFFILQYGLGWLKNITPKKIRSSLVIFDRYFDDMLIDHTRYRYGGSKSFAKFIRNFIPRPEVYFVLTADATTIHNRKQEVPFKELERQIKGYRKLADGKRYVNIDVNKSPGKIVREVTNILMQRMSERY